MKFLLDEGMASRVATFLNASGHEAAHLRDLGLTSAPDPVVLEAAARSKSVLITLDTDFGALIAHSRDSLPSVVLFRGDVTRRPERQASLLLANLDQFEQSLRDGALVVIGDNRIWIRELPISPG